MGRSLTHKKALDAILFGDSNGGGTGGSGDKVSTAPVIVYKTATIEAQGMYTVAFTPSSLSSKSKILGMLDYSVLDANGDTLQLSLVSAKLTSDEKSVEAIFFNAMLINLDATTFMAISGANLTYYALSGSTRAATGNHTISAYVAGALE